MPRFDLDLVRQAAATRWPEVISCLGGVDESILDGGHHPCPRCGGTDRFNLSREGTGGAFCNQCFTSKNGDGFATIQWLTGQDFATVIAKVANHLGVKPSKGRKAADPAEHLSFHPWNDTLVGMWCLKKKPIRPEAVKAVGGQVATYRGQYTVIAIPVLGPSLDEAGPVGWVIYRADGKELPKWTPGKKEPDWVKVKLTAGSSKGIITDLDRFRSSSAPVWKVEGPTDLLAMLSQPASQPPIAFTTANGAGEKPLEWIVKLCEGRTVFVCHDADKPGQDGATFVPQRDGQKRPGWCPSLAAAAKEVRNVRLPFPIEPNHGPDLRDFFNGGGSLESLQEFVDAAEVFGTEKEAESFVEEHEDDPQRLARVNLARYQDSHDGRLVYWRDEWWKWKSGRYRKIEPSELRAKVWAAVRTEFERCWRDRVTKGDDKPVKKVTKALVANVVGAMESMCCIPSSAPMPCWLPDRSQPRYVSCKNGILDLDAVFGGRPIEEWVIDHSPSWFSTFRLEYPFDPSADCPKWKEYLSYCLDDDMERISILQEWAGYLLTGSNDFQRFLVLEGEGGNGKTVYFAGMTAMLGEENVSHVSIENFGGRFELGSTIGKAANISGDAGEIDGIAEGVLKQFTGGDVMQFDRKNLAPISVRPTAKLMAAWNSRPRIKDKSMGLWRRMLLVPFDKQIEAHRRVLGMDKPSWWLEQGEAPGILLWAITGLNRLMENRGFTKSEVTEAAIAEYREESNPAIEFFNDFIEPSVAGEIESDRLYELYTYWAKKTGIRHPLGCRQFGRELRRKFSFVERKRKRERGNLQWCYSGIQFSTEQIFSEPVLKDGSLF